MEGIVLPIEILKLNKLTWLDKILCGFVTQDPNISYKELAKVLGLSETWLCFKLKRIKKRMKKEIRLDGVESLIVKSKQEDIVKSKRKEIKKEKKQGAKIKKENKFTIPPLYLSVLQKVSKLCDFNTQFSRETKNLKLSFNFLKVIYNKNMDYFKMFKLDNEFCRKGNINLQNLPYWEDEKAFLLWVLKVCGRFEELKKRENYPLNKKILPKNLKDFFIKYDYQAGTFRSWFLYLAFNEKPRTEKDAKFLANGEKAKEWVRQVIKKEMGGSEKEAERLMRDYLSFAEKFEWDLNPVKLAKFWIKIKQIIELLMELKEYKFIAWKEWEAGTKRFSLEEVQKLSWVSDYAQLSLWLEWYVKFFWWLKNAEGIRFTGFDIDDFGVYGHKWNAFLTFIEKRFGYRISIAEKHFGMIRKPGKRKDEFEQAVERLIEAEMLEEEAEEIEREYDYEEEEAEKVNYRNVDYEQMEREKQEEEWVKLETLDYLNSLGNNDELIKEKLKKADPEAYEELMEEERLWEEGLKEVKEKGIGGEEIKLWEEFKEDMSKYAFVDTGKWKQKFKEELKQKQEIKKKQEQMECNEDKDIKPYESEEEYQRDYEMFKEIFEQGLDVWLEKNKDKLDELGN